MKQLLINLLNKILDTGLSKFFDVILRVIHYLTICKESKIEKDHKKEVQTTNKVIDDVCNNGSLQDLLNIKDKL